MKPVIALLKNLGLSNTEIKLYINGLQYSKVNVAVLVQRSNVKRTTAYHALETLCEKGLAVKSKEDGKLFYKMTPASELDKMLHKRRDQLESQITELKSVAPLFPTPSRVNDSLPDVSNYHGIKSVQAAIDRALYCKDRQWRIVSPRNNYFRNSTPEYIAYFKSKREDRGIIAKSLWESSLKQVEQLSNEDIEHRRPRIMPSIMDGKFKSSIIIFDDQVLIVSSYRQQFATLITSAETAQTLAVMFDAIWEISQPLKT